MGITRLKGQSRFIVNVGSVGQPRDGDNRAKYVIWDTDQDVIEVRFIRYDIEKVVKKILAAGLPEVHANRLW
jgi:diadenosine tetraphosphatase ApaH/serine/threonine PP2A family protein phosphatase